MIRLRYKEWRFSVDIHIICGIYLQETNTFSKIVSATQFIPQFKREGIDHLDFCAKKYSNYSSFLRLILFNEMFEHFKMVRPYKFSDKTEIYFEKNNQCSEKYPRSKIGSKITR